MLSLIIAEAALETVPKTIAGHSAVRKHALRKGRVPSEILLDRSYHNAAMSKLKNNFKRGRPDLVHFVLQEAISTPLYQRGMVKIYLHTVTDRVIFINSGVRLPKSYFRFEGLMEKLFKKGKIDSAGQILLELKDMNFSDLLRSIKPHQCVGLSRTGVRKSAEEIVKDIDNGALVVGGFPHGHFSSSVTELLDAICSISDVGLEAHIVVARILYEYEKAYLDS